VTRKPRRDERRRTAVTDEQRAMLRAARRDEQLREQTRTEVEQRPYLDTEGGE